MKRAMLYVHGKGGSAAEAETYKAPCSLHDVIGVEYTDDRPWIVREQIKAAYDGLAGHYDEISLIANSIGAYFAMLALHTCAITKAYLISPILNMEQLITDMMAWAGVSENVLAEKKTLPTDFGETLSWEYLCYVRDHPIHWRAPTAILYAGKDHLTSRATVNEFVSSHNATLTVMENGEHWFHTEAQMAFLGEWMRSEAAACDAR